MKAMLKPAALLGALASTCLGLTIVPAPSAQADAGGVVRFGTLPPGAPGHPEGLAADENGNIYAASFELTAVAPPMLGGPFPPRRKGPQGDPLPPFDLNYIYTFGSNGRLKTSTPLPEFGSLGAPVVPLGMVVSGSNLFANDVFNGDAHWLELELTPSSSPVAVFHICGGFVSAFFDPGAFCALNANDVGPDGRVYMSDNGAGPNVIAGAGAVFQDSFLNGRIFVLDPTTGASSVFFDSDELDVGGPSHDPSAFPEFGVNGIAFAPDGSALYMANMSTDTIYKLTLDGCAMGDCMPGMLSVFVPPGNGIDGPDNMVFDDEGNLWVASGQNDTVVAINPLGQVIKQVGSFQGFSKDGAPKGLLQPSGIAFSRGKIFIGSESNETLRPADEFPPGFWDQLEAFTVSRINP